MSIPPRVRYSAIPVDENERVLVRFLDSLEDPLQMVSFQGNNAFICGPHLVTLLNRGGLMTTLDFKRVIMGGTIDSKKEFLVGCGIRRASIPRVVKLIRNLLFSEHELIVRKLTWRELDWYWTIISWDIEEPIVVLENARHRLMIHFNRDGKLFFVELFDNLRWGGELEAMSDEIDRFYVLGQYDRALSTAVRTLDAAQRQWQPDDLRLARLLKSLAILYRHQGDYAKAESSARQALSIRQKNLGPESPDVAVNLLVLGSILDCRGAYPEAEQLLKRSLDLSEKALSPDDPQMAGPLNNLAAVYCHQERYALAEPLLVRSLSIGEKTLGPDHPDVAGVMNNLAVVYVNRGKYSDAEPLYKRAMAIFEHSFGSRHSSVLMVLDNLADLCRDTGREQEAVVLEQRAAAIRALEPQDAER